MLIFAVLMTFLGFLQVIPMDALRDTLPAPAIQDTTQFDQTLDVEEQEEVIPDTVYVWKYKFPESFEIGETDSTLRWDNMVNLFDRFYQKRGAITYRMGTVGRMDGITLHAFETRYMNLEMEGLDLNDPLTGAVNWNRLPYHKISAFYEKDYGASYRSMVRLRDHYLLKPRTYLNFDESQYDYRNLEFSYTQNFVKSTNLELSFWDRRDGGGYSRQGVEGRQIVARAYHQLNDRWLLKVGYINNGMNREEPFGYSLTSPLLFTFNTFSATPNQSNAKSNQTTNDAYLQIHHRADTLKTVSSILGLHYQGSKWSLSYNADSVATNFQKVEFFGRQRISFSKTEFIATGRAFLLSDNEKKNLTQTRWMGAEGQLDATQKIGKFFQLDGSAKITAWDDGRQSREISGRLELMPWSRLKMSAFGGILSNAQDIQALYWQSDEYTGSPDLKNEESQLMGAQLEIGITKSLWLGARADIRDTDNAVFVYDNQFQSIDPYSMTSGTAWISLNSRIFEGEISGTYKTYTSNSLQPVNQLLSGSGDIVWFKSRLYWKNYMFHRATFVKAGFSGIYSPNPFRTAEFITPLNRWQHGTNEFINPSYYRLDVDVSARIRWFMVVLKWENVLDQLEQPGYFETVGYPMPGRRFRFGVRVLFTN